MYIISSLFIIVNVLSVPLWGSEQGKGWSGEEEGSVYGWTGVAGLIVIFWIVNFSIVMIVMCVVWWVRVCLFVMRGNLAVFFRN